MKRTITAAGMLLLIIYTLPLFSQISGQQVMVEAKFVEINSNSIEAYGLRLAIDGSYGGNVSGIKLKPKEGWSEVAVPASLPDGWDLSTAINGEYNFSGPSTRLPIQLDWLVPDRPASSFGFLMMGDSLGHELPNVTFDRMNLPNIAPEKLDSDGEGFYIRPFLDWRTRKANIPHLERSVKTHQLQGLQFIDYDVFAEGFDNFSTVRSGLSIGRRLGDNLDINFEGAYADGCGRMFKQGWSYQPDPLYNVKDKLKFDLNTFSLGARLNYQLPQRGSILDDLELTGGVGVDLHKLTIGYDHRHNTPMLMMFDKGTLSGTATGIYLDVGVTYRIWDKFELGLGLGYGTGLFEHITGDVKDETGGKYEAELSMEPIENGDFLTIHPTEDDYAEGFYPAKIDLKGFHVDLRLSYELHLGGTRTRTPKETEAKEPDTTKISISKEDPPPKIYGEEIDDGPQVWNAYVYIGSIRGNAQIYEAAIINSADEAISDFEAAGYNVIANYTASIADFRKILDDPNARAFWYAGHGTEDDNGPIPMIKDVRNEGISPSTEYFPSEASILFRKDKLNQVTMHACKQDLPEWREAFPGATFDAWSMSPIGPMMYYWQLAATYPVIDQATGEEKGKRPEGIAPITGSTAASRR